jgi:prepilin-type N-terminal cleavage/methylation domain-containing protein
LKNRLGGFTLVELLVVVLILSVLMAVALPLYLGAIQSSERATARANMQTLANANASYRLRYGVYASDMPTLLQGGDLTQAISGPGNPPRKYTFLMQGSCDQSGDVGNPNVQNIPQGGFAVQSSMATDGCYIPSVSTQ